MQDEGTVEMPGTITVDKIEQPVKIENIEESSIVVENPEGQPIIIQNPDDRPITIDNFDGQSLRVEEVNKTFTLFETEHGKIYVKHEMTLGDVVTSTILLAILFFMIIESFIRR